MIAPVGTANATMLLRIGRVLEGVTLVWNVVGMIILGVAAVRAHSVALAGFGLDSLIEIGASIVVLWELSGAGEARQRRALRLIAVAFLALAAYLLVQTAIVFATGSHPQPSPLGITWTASSAAAMFTLAAGKNRTGHALNNPVLITESRVTVIDGLLACAVLLGLGLNATLGWWWADPEAATIALAPVLDSSAPVTNRDLRAFALINLGIAELWTVRLDYVTKVQAHHFREVACFVHGPHGGSVIVAATLASNWPMYSAAVECSVEAYAAT